MIYYNKDFECYSCFLYYKIRLVNTNCKISLNDCTSGGYKIII